MITLYVALVCAASPLPLSVIVSIPSQDSEPVADTTTTQARAGMTTARASSNTARIGNGLRSSEFISVLLPFRSDLLGVGPGHTLGVITFLHSNA